MALNFVPHPKKDFSTKFLHLAPWCIWNSFFQETGFSLYFLSKSKTNVPSTICEIVPTLLWNLKCELFHIVNTHTCLGLSNAYCNYPSVFSPIISTPFQLLWLYVMFWYLVEQVLLRCSFFKICIADIVHFLSLLKLLLYTKEINKNFKIRGRYKEQQ